MELSDELLTEVAFVQISKYRSRVLKSLDGQVKIPSQIGRDAEIIQNHVSGTLKQLKEHGLVECINPEVKKGRLYRQTDRGKTVSENLDIKLVSH